jgi:SAM-dependent methyltransferase
VRVSFGPHDSDLMSSAETDRIQEEYKRRERAFPPDFYSFTKPANLLLRQTRERAVIRMLARSNSLPLERRRILDVGCGDGQWLIDFETWGADRANLAGIDLISTRVRNARARLAAWKDDEGRVLSEGADIREGDAAHLPWGDEAFDIVCQSMMFSSILDATVRTAVAKEMVRVLAPDGIIIWYDFFVDNPSNRNVRGVRKHEVVKLFPDFRIDGRRITLLPPLTRRLASRSWLLAEMLAMTKLLNTHLLVTLKR